MKHQSAHGILRPGKEGPVYLTLSCAFGQSIYTEVSYLENGQTVKPITSFRGNVANLQLAMATEMLNREFRIFCTVQDVIDKNQGEPDEDIMLTVKVRCNQSKVEETWKETTEGTGSIFTYSLDVQVL